MERNTIDLGKISDARMVWYLMAFADSIKHGDPYTTLLLRAQEAFDALETSWLPDMQQHKGITAIEWMGYLLTREVVGKDIPTDEHTTLKVVNDGTGYRTMRKIDVASAH